MDRDSRDWIGISGPTDRADAAIRRHLRKLRSEAGMTQEQIAQAMNMERSVFSKYETGKLRLNEDFLSRFARLFQTDAETLRQKALAESPENQTPERQSEELRQRLDISFSTEKPDFLPGSSRFFGRKWLVQEVESWLDNPDGSRLMVLYGDPGIGKTSFSARLVHSSTRIPGCLFCNAQDPRFRDPRIFIRTLAWLLACSLPDYRLSLVSVLADCRDLETLTTPELRELLIENPLRDQLLFDDGMEILCVVVDGVDAVSPEETSEMARLLAETARNLPKWVRILVTSRETDSVKAALADFPCLRLCGTDQRNQADVREYLTAVLKKQSQSTPDWDAALENLLQRSGGIFLYAQAMCESILSGRMSVRSQDSLPESLSPAFHRWFTDLFPDEAEYQTLWGPGIAMILTSPEPIPREELRRTLAWTQAQEDSFFQRMNLLLRADTDVFRKEIVEITDPFLRLWLTGAARDRDIYEVSLSDALDRMADAFFARMKRDGESLSEYEALHLQEFLEKTGRTEQLKEARISWTLACRLHNAGNLGSRDKEQIDDPLPDRCYELCREICIHLISQSDNPKPRHLLARASFQLGQNRCFRNDPDGAIAGCKAALKQEQILLKRDPDNSAYRSHVLWCCWGTALALKDKKKHRAALRYCERGLKAGEQQILKNGTCEDKKVLCQLYSLKGDLLNAKHRRKGALAEFEKSFALETQIREEVPDFRRDISHVILLNTAAKLAQSLNNLPRARDLYLAAAAEAESLHEADPSDWYTLTAQFELSQSLSDVMQALEQTDAEKDFNSRAAELAEKKLTLQTSNKTLQFSDSYDMMMSGILAANMEYENGNLDRAQELCEDVLQSMPFLRQTGDSYLWNCAEGITYHTLGRILNDRKDYEGALEKCLRSLNLLNRADAQLKETDNRGPIDTQSFLDDRIYQAGQLALVLLQEKRMTLNLDEAGTDLLRDLLSWMLPLSLKLLEAEPDDDFRIEICRMFLEQAILAKEQKDDNLVADAADQILRIAESVKGADDLPDCVVLQAKALHLKAGVRKKQAENRTETIRLCRQAEARFQHLFDLCGSSDWGDWCESCLDLGALLREQGAYGEAMVFLRKSISLIETHIPRKYTMKIGTRIDCILRSLAELSVCLRASGDTEAARACYGKIQNEIQAFPEVYRAAFPPKTMAEEQKADHFCLDMMIRMRKLASDTLKNAGDSEGAELFSLERAILFRQDT